MKARYGWEVLADYNIMFRKKMHFGQLSLKKAHLFHIMCITQLRSGEIWVGSSGRGIFRIRKDTGTGEQMTDIPDVSEHAHYGVIYEDRHGSIWIG